MQAAQQNSAANEAVQGSAIQWDQIRFADELFDAGPQVLELSLGPIVLGGELSIIGPGRDENGAWLLSLDGMNATGVDFIDEALVVFFSSVRFRYKGRAK